MHIATRLAWVARAPVQSDVPTPPGRIAVRPAPLPARNPASPVRRWLRKAWPGCVLLAVLALAGALVPIVF